MSEGTVHLQFHHRSGCGSDGKLRELGIQDKDVSIFQCAIFRQDARPTNDWTVRPQIAIELYCLVWDQPAAQFWYASALSYPSWGMPYCRSTDPCPDFEISMLGLMFATFWE